MRGIICGALYAGRALYTGRNMRGAVYAEQLDYRFLWPCLEIFFHLIRFEIYGNLEPKITVSKCAPKAADKNPLNELNKRKSLANLYNVT
jgi:hypothetical protein